MPRRKRKAARQGLDKHSGDAHTEPMLQLIGNSSQIEPSIATLVELRRGDAGILQQIDLPGDDARRLMEMGFLPGMRIVAGSSAPGGDPRVFQVDGSEVALRRETAKLLKVRLESGKTPRKA